MSAIPSTIIPKHSFRNLNRIGQPENVEKTIRTGIKSAQATFEGKMGVINKPEVNWSKARRISSLISPRIHQERENKQTDLDILMLSHLRENSNKPKFIYMVVKTEKEKGIGIIYSPIGFAGASFISKIDLFKFAVKQGREKVKINNKTYVAADEVAQWETKEKAKADEIQRVLDRKNSKELSTNVY